jgi:hypothetical protein
MNLMFPVRLARLEEKKKPLLSALTYGKFE